MGKTALALNFAEYAAIHAKKTVGLFSLEMSKEQLVDRLISSIGKIDSWKLRNGKLNDDDFRNLNEAYGVLAEANLFIDDTPSASVMEVRAKARRLQVEHGLDMVIVDYLQLMQGSNPGNADNRTQEVSEISRSLKGLAKELKCPVIALSQLSRAVESRPDKRPLLSDLRESGGIEQDADVVMFLYREDYYNKEEQSNIMEVLVRKHRNGPTGDAKVLARLQFSRFENLDLQHLPKE
jgi:replicative DNA helicase